MARNISTNECGRRILGIVRTASTVPPAAPPRRAYDVGAAHIDAPAWVVSWTVTR